MSSIKIVCRAWSTGVGTGNPCSCKICHPIVSALELHYLKLLVTFINAHSFCAARRDMYIHEADFLFPM
jgi:hypothetical protein